MEQLSNTANVEIRQMRDEDVEMGMKAFEGEYDHFDAPATVRVYLKTDPSAFFVACVKNTNKIIGIIGAPIGPNNTAFIGLYGVLEEYRGSGVGKLLFEKCLDFAGERNVSLFAVSDMRQKYIDRYKFTGSGVSMTSYGGVVKKNRFDESINDKDSDIKITTINLKQDEQVLKDLIKFDKEILNLTEDESREQLILNALQDSTNYHSRIALSKSSNQVMGFGCLRKHGMLENTFICGPVYGKSLDFCKKMLSSIIDSLITSDEGQISLVYNGIDANEQSLLLASEFLGLSFTGKCEILHQKPVSEPQYQYQHIYSVFSLDFGV